MTTTCCCYTVNEGYLLPTLLSAVQARQHLSAGTADVVIICIGEANGLTRAFEAICRNYGIGFIVVPLSLLEGMPLTFARFFLCRVLDPVYDQVVYIDGDTQVHASLDALVGVTFEAGKFLAAPDPMAMMIDAPGRLWASRRRYFRSIGIPDGRRSSYFNAGVLRFRRSDWETISAECVRLSRSKNGAYLFHDQDALNVAFGDACQPMSLRWNFPIFLINAGVEDVIKPSIYHFMSNPRPWTGAFAPWGRPLHTVYRDLVGLHPDLRPLVKPLTRAKFFKYKAQQRYKQFIESHVWGHPDVRARIMRFESQAVV